MEIKSKGPGAMSDRFNKMPVDNTELFLIKPLHVSASPSDQPSPLIRSSIHCFFFITHGETLITIGEKSYLFKANECAIIPAGQFFSIRYYNSCHGYMGGFHSDFLYSDNGNKNLLSVFGFLRQWGNHKVYFEPEKALFITNIFERLVSETGSGKNKDIIKAYLTALLVEVDTVYRAMEVEDSAHPENKICNLFVESVFNKPDMRLSIADYAARQNISEAYLYRIVKQHTGKTPLSWIHEAVISEAKIMLENTDQPVSEIADRIGIDDPSYFSRLFKQRTGYTPLAYRKLKNP